MDCRNLKINIVRSFETSGNTTTKTHHDIPDDFKNRTIIKSTNFAQHTQATHIAYMGEVSNKCRVSRFQPFTGHEGPQGEQRYSSTLFQTSTLEGGEGSASHPGSTLPPGKTRYILYSYRRLGGPQGRSGQVRKISPHRDSIPDCPARRQSLYRLRYPAYEYKDVQRD